MFAENEAFELDSKFLGALPVVNHFLARLQIDTLLDKRLPPPRPSHPSAAHPGSHAFVAQPDPVEGPLVLRLRVGGVHAAGRVGSDR